MEAKYVFNNEGFKIDGLFLLKPKIFNDERGYFLESWNKKEFSRILKKDFNFKQDNFSYSSNGVLRGLHYQVNPNAQDKLVSCLEGKIFDVAIDLRKNSKTFGDWAGLWLDDINHEQFFIPKGFAHGFLVVSEYAKVKYKTTSFYSTNSERAIIWNDSDINVNWPLEMISPKSPIISHKDSKADKFKNCDLDMS